MRKKALCALLSVAMMTSMFTACGSDDKSSTSTSTSSTTTSSSTGTSSTSTSSTDSTSTSSSEEPGPVTADTMAAPSVDGWDSSKEIYVYSWNAEFGSRLAYLLGNADADGNPLIYSTDDAGKITEVPEVKGTHEELAKYVHYVNLGCSGTDGTYQKGVQTAMESGDKYPSVIAADNDVAKYFFEDPKLTVNLEDIGITDEMYANAYKYTKDYATVDGKLKALTWQAACGNFTYRYSIAEKVLGSGEPDKVQEYVKDWDTFFKTADTMKENGYYMLSGPDDVKYAIWDQQTTPWVTVNSDGTESLTLDSSVTDYFETAKKLYDGDYTNKTSMWSAEWSANMADDGKVFGYFGCTWFVYWCIAGAKGDWRVCQGPVSYHWGGTYVAVTPGCPNNELAAYLIYSLCCDKDYMYNVEKETLDFVNNKAAVAQIIADGLGASDILGGQNPVETWAAAAEKIDLSNASYLDSELKALMDTAAEGYNTGTYATVEDAVKYVKDSVAAKYDYIKVN